MFLVWALGAARVARAQGMDAARDLVAAADGAWDFVYVEAADRECAEKTWGRRGAGGGGGGGGGVRVVDDEWVVQSLILGRLIDDD